MNIFKVVIALILTPFAAVAILLVMSGWLLFMDNYGEDILGFGLLFGWLTLIFCVILKLLS